MESEWIDGLLEYPEWFGILCRYSLPMDEPEARWQFADRLRFPTGAGSASLCGPVLEQEEIST